MEDIYKNCQSCGMPLRKDPQGGGTNADGSKSSTYCSYCFHLGQFTQPNITAEEMRTFCKNKLKELGYPGLVASFLTMGVPKLGRWKQSKQ